MAKINYPKQPKKALFDKQFDKQNDKHFWQIFISRNVSQDKHPIFI